MGELSDAILKVTKDVTKEWTKQRKAEERGSRNRYSRAYVYSDRVNFTEVVDELLVTERTLRVSPSLFI